MVFFLALDCTPKAKAIVPAVLVEAALLSYVTSSGYRLWVDNGTGDDLLGLVSDLYDTFLQNGVPVPGTALTIQQLASDNHVYTDNSGNIVVDHVAADIFQQFSEWIQTDYNIATDGTKVSVVAGVSSGDIYTYNGYQFRRFVLNRSIVINGTTYYTSTEPIFIRNGGSYYFGSTSSGAIVFAYYLITFSGSVEPHACSSNINTLYFCVSEWDYIGSFGVNSSLVGSALGSFKASQVQNNILPYQDGSNNSGFISDLVAPASSPGLLASLSSAVADLAVDVVSGKSLILDVGAASGDTPAQIADTVVAGYDAVTGTLPVTDTVVATEVIDTPVQEYPDFDNLGLPQLGLALIERFPFCIPFDFVRIVRLFDAEPVAPYIVIDLIPDSVKQRVGIVADTSFTLDFRSGTYATMGLIIRWGSLLGFCLGLLLLTRKLIWTS